MRVTVALRSPLTFRIPGPLTEDSMKAPPDTVAIAFERWDFVWHPPMEREDEHGKAQYGPMLAAVVDDGEMTEVSHAVQRFLSAVAYVYGYPVEEDRALFIGGDGENDAYNPHGRRSQRSHAFIFKADAPAVVTVEDDATLHVALAYYREALNAGSPFYACLAFRNVLDAVYEVEHELQQDRRTPTRESAARDSFIDAAAPRLTALYGLDAPPAGGWAHYLREEVRNALAHVRRSGRREVNPDHPEERVRLRADASLLQHLARAAIEQQWPQAVRLAPRN